MAIFLRFLAIFLRFLAKFLRRQILIALLLIMTELHESYFYIPRTVIFMNYFAKLQKMICK